MRRAMFAASRVSGQGIYRKGVCPIEELLQPLRSCSVRWQEVESPPVHSNAARLNWAALGNGHGLLVQSKPRFTIHTAINA